MQRENIEYPNSLWVKLVVDQISFAEWKELKTNIPVTEIKMQEFDLAAFELEVTQITRKMPVFHAKDVRKKARFAASIVANF